MDDKPHQEHPMKNGFTLLELLVTVAIAATLILFAVPAFTTLTANNNMTAGINNFVSGLRAARAEAVKRDVRVGICPSVNGSDCVTDGANWSAGWLIYVDADTDGSRGAGEELIRVGEHDGSPAIRQTAAIPISYQGTGFRSRGQPETVFDFCDDRGADYARRVTVNLVGRHTVCHGPKSPGEDKCAADELPECGG